MIFKERDSSDERLNGLRQLLQHPITPQHRKRVEKDIALISAGVKGEQNTAYFIDFHLKDNKNWVVIHDLRIEWNGRVAQIDHILLNRLMEIYVVESKSFRSKIRFANGGWERLNCNYWEGIASPVDQNERHILVLNELLRDHEFAPKRFGLSPSYFNIVAVQPSCSVIGDIPKDARVLRTDSLVKKILSIDPSVFNVLKIITADTLHAFGRSLVACHKPSALPQPSIREFEAIPKPLSHESVLTTEKCQNCGGGVSEAETNFCKSKKMVFAGHILCRKCQAYARNPKTEPVACSPLEGEDASLVARCAQCSAGVDQKVVAYCRFNSKRWSGRILCRSCQPFSTKTPSVVAR
jgi:hypothetical protein